MAFFRLEKAHRRVRADCRQKAILPRRERIALSANERIAEFLDFAIQAKSSYVNKLSAPKGARSRMTGQAKKGFGERFPQQAKRLWITRGIACDFCQHP